jgi:hypothetical protein
MGKFQARVSAEWLFLEGLVDVEHPMENRVPSYNVVFVPVQLEILLFRLVH